MDDAHTYQITGTNVFEQLEKRLNAMVSYESRMSGRPVDELWQFVEEVAGKAQVSKE